MSFILDALKKSETSRQQHTGPAFADVPAGRPRSPRPWWALAVVALLAVNLAVLAVVLLRDPPPDKPVASADVKPAAMEPAPLPTAAPPQPDANAAALARPDPVSPTGPPAVSAPPPEVASDQVTEMPRDPAVRPLAEEAFGSGAAAYEPPEGRSEEAPDLSVAASVPEGPPAVRPLAGSTIPADQPSYPENLPTVNDLALRGGPGVPELHLDIHVYSADQAERFVFINLKKYVEGETLKEGPAVERITREGVILNHRGLRFVLPRQ